MADFRTLLNRALIDLGHYDDRIDTTATTLTDAYHVKLAEWFNDVLEEIEDAANWRVLRQRDTATITAGALSGSLALSNERSRVFRVQDVNTSELIPLAFDVTNASSQVRLIEMGVAQILFLDQQNSNQTSANGPQYFALQQTATGTDIYVWPRSTAQVSIEIDMIIPQSRLSYVTSNGLSTSILVPNRQVVQGLVWWAMEDRGEEFGPDGQTAEVRFRNMLSDLAAAENAAQGFDVLVPT